MHRTACELLQLQSEKGLVAARPTRLSSGGTEIDRAQILNSRLLYR
jgi:hypothetical protein